MFQFVMFTKILHLNSLSDSDNEAFNHALSFALQFRSNLSILHVDPVSNKDHPWEQYPGVRDQLIAWQRLPPGAEKEEVYDKLGVAVRKLDLKNDDPVSAAIKYVRRKETELIVLSNGGRQGISRWISPSISEPVARSNNVPCLFVPEKCQGIVEKNSGEISVNRILIPIDHEPDYSPAVSMATSLARELGLEEPEITFLHVGEKLKEFATSITVEYEMGRAQDVICERAQNADLVLMVTAGHTSFLDALIGSTTEQVVRMAPCPVLTIPASG